MVYEKASDFTFGGAVRHAGVRAEATRVVAGNRLRFEDPDGTPGARLRAWRQGHKSRRSGQVPGGALRRRAQPHQGVRVRGKLGGPKADLWRGGVKDLPPEQKRAAEMLFRHPVSEDEAVSIKSLWPTALISSKLPPEHRVEALRTIALSTNAAAAPTWQTARHTLPRALDASPRSRSGRRARE